MPGCSMEKCRNCVRLERASYSRLASEAMVSFGSIGLFLGLRTSGFFESSVQVIVLEGAGFTELVEFERQRQSAPRIFLFEVRLHDLEQAAAGRLLGGIAPAGADLQYGVHESRIAQAAVGDTILVARDGAHPHTAGWKHRRSFDLERRHELRELAA